MQNNKFSLFTIILVSIFIGFFSFGLYRVYLSQKELSKELTKVKEEKSEPKEVKEVIEKIVTKVDPWADVLAKASDTVVQVFSQLADFNWLEPYKTPEQSQATGSGFFINDKGFIITNAHVVNQAKAVSIQIPSMGRELLDVDIVGICFDRDLALLKVKDEDISKIKSVITNLPYLKLGDSDKVGRGQEVMTLGYPLGQQLKSTLGIVSGRESVRRQMIQIDAPINPGNSGCPVLSLNGDVIGIATSGITTAQNVGYIIPVNELKIILEDLFNPPKNKLIRKPFLGIFYTHGSLALTKYLGNPFPGGIYVTSIYEGSLLDKAGVKPGDMIYEVNGQKIDLYGDIQILQEDKIALTDYISFFPLGKEVELVAYRNGVRKSFKVNFIQSKLPEVRIKYPDYEKIDYEVVGGMIVMELARNHVPLLITYAAELIKYEEAINQVEPVLVITHVLPDSQGQRSRILSPGTRIKELNGMVVKTLKDFRKAIKKSLETNYLTIKTYNEIFTVFDIGRVLQDELRLPKLYRYQVSKVVEEMMKAYLDKLDKNGKEATGSIASGKAV